MQRQFINTIIILSFLLNKTHSRKAEKIDYISYSPWWVTSRVKFKFPIHFTSLRIYYFDEWDKFKSLWWKAWPLVEGANYEVPQYLQNKHYIPTNWKDHCQPGSKSMGDDYMLDDFSSDDYKQPSSVRDLVSNQNSYWFGDWLYLFIFFYNLCYCLRGLNTGRTCPNACWRPNVCINDPNSVRICRPIRDPSAAQSMHSARKNQFAEIYSAGYECICRAGFKFSQRKKKCVQLKVSCNDKRYGKMPCRNKGICVPLAVKDRPIASVTFQCICPPAWEGYVCQAPRNPCRYKEGICGMFPCQRDPVSEVFGYSCTCSKGYAPASQAYPGCVNVNECQDEYANPCMNGGVCQDLTPPPMAEAKPGEELRFKCKCKFGFTGMLCEVPPPQLAWSEWGDWSSCSVTCGMGTRTRSRECPRPGECPGKQDQSGICGARVLSCEAAGNKTDDGGKSTLQPYSEEEILRDAGVLWTEEDEFLLEDAFTWSEQQFGIRGSSRRREHAPNTATRLGDLTQWMFLFGGLTKRMTLRQMAEITIVLALTSMLSFCVLLITIRACQPHDIRPDTELHEYAMEQLNATNASAL